MARSRKNDMTFGMSGRLGKMISYRQMGGETEAFRRPGKRDNDNPTPEQAEHRERFLAASYYAKAVQDDPVKNAVYKPKTAFRKSVYNLALADYMKAPEVKSVNTDNYHGQVGNTISIRAIDDFKVTAVKVSILDANGAILEQGGAVMEPNRLDWTYTATAANAQLAGSKISVAASDLPGNITRKETVL